MRSFVTVGMICGALACGNKETTKQASAQGSAAGSAPSAAGSAVADRCAAAASTLGLYVAMLEGPADSFTNAPAFEQAAAGACRKFRWPPAVVDCFANAKTAEQAMACDHKGLEAEVVAFADESSLKVHDPAACELYQKEIDRFNECPKLAKAIVEGHKKELAAVARPVTNAGAITCIKSLNVLDETLLDLGCKSVPGSKGKRLKNEPDDPPPPEPEPDEPAPPAAPIDKPRKPGQYKMQKH